MSYWRICLTIDHILYKDMSYRKNYLIEGHVCRRTCTCLTRIHILLEDISYSGHVLWQDMSYGRTFLMGRRFRGGHVLQEIMFYGRAYLRKGQSFV